MKSEYVVQVFDVEASVLDSAVRNQPTLRPFFSDDAVEPTNGSLRESYIRLLKVKHDYVQYTVPMLRAAGTALANGDEEDRIWSKLFLDYAGGESEGEERYGHHVWARNDMLALGASTSFVEAPPHPSVIAYGEYFAASAPLHPYAILGAKGVLEHLSIRMSDDLVKGVIRSDIDNAKNAVSFFSHHGVLDIDHVREGDRNLGRIENSRKLAQILEGAYFTSGSYRAFLQFAL